MMVDLIIITAKWTTVGGLEYFPFRIKTYQVLATVTGEVESINVIKGLQ